MSIFGVSVNKKQIFRRSCVFCLALTFFALMTGCSSDSDSEKKDHFLKVNDFELTESEFNSSLKFEIDADRNFDVSEGIDTKVVFLNDLIRKQLLIQEARKQQLDRQEDFRRAIERYWESTLIRDLLARKSKEMQAQAAVTSEETQAFFKENSELFATQKFEEVSEDIARMLAQEKVNQLMEEWTDSLVEAAKIEVSDPVLKEKMKTKAY